MRPFLIALLVASILNSSLAQPIKGRVKDSIGNPIPYASVNLKDKGIIISYTTTDTGGAYSLRPQTGMPLSNPSIEVHGMGYKDQTKSLTTLPATLDFTLYLAPGELQSVVVHNNRPILRTRGDTLSYKVADFTNAQDRVIGDVIKRLPGVTVANDGTIYYNNKPISGVYISGDNLLDDKYTIATNSIPQDIVDQVQLIDNHQPIKVLQNKIASNDVALNLDMKRSAGLHLIGRESLGAGLPGNYDINGNVMMFKDRYKAINYVKGNNTGDNLQRDLTSHNAGDNQQRIGNDLPATLLSLGTVNDPALARQRYFFNQSGMLNTNNLVNWKNDWQLRLNAGYLHDQQRQDYSQQITTFLPDDTIQYTETQHNRFNPELLHTQLTLTANKQKGYLNDILLIDENRRIGSSHLTTNGSAMDQTLKDNSKSFSNEFNGIISTRSNNILQGWSYISHFAEPEDRTTGPSVQRVGIPTWYTNNYFSFKVPGDILTKSFRTGFGVQSQRLTSNLSPLRSDSSVNNLAWLKKKTYAEAAFDIPGEDRKLKASLTLPVTALKLNYADAGYALEKTLTRVYFNPQLIGKYQTGREDYLNFQYGYNNEAGNIEDIYQGYILKDYRTLYANNADLTLRQNNHAVLGYNHRKALKLLFISITASYDRIHANNIASSIITDSFQQHIVLPYSNNTGSRTLSGSVSKYSFRIRTTFSTGIQWQNNRTTEIQNGTLLHLNTTTLTLTGNADTRINDQLNFSYHATATQTTGYDRVDQLTQLLSIYYSPTPDLQFNTTGEHYFTRGKGNPDLKYFFADASAKLHLKKRNIDLQLTASNFLNVKRYNALYLTTNTLTSSSYILPGRIVLLKVFFSLD